MSDKKFVNIQNSRPGKYEGVIKEIAEKKVCPFCPDQIQNFHKNPILIEGDFWLATNNMYPYKATRNHIIFIYKTHIENFDELVPAAWNELHSMAKKLIDERKIAGGAIMFRFGDTEFTGASVTHLHAHLVQSNPDDPAYDKKTGLLARLG